MSEQRVRAQVFKAEASPTTKQIYKDDFEGLYGVESDILKPPYILTELKMIGEYSSILQQCIDAYKTNIVGFGIEAEHKQDINSEDIQEPERQQALEEHTRLEEFIRYLNLDESPEIVLSYVIDDKEKTGNGYAEVIRDGTGMPVGIEYVDAEYIRVCKRSKPEDVEYTILENGVEKKVTRKKRFRKYVQLIDEKKVYFKEYGDPRHLDSQTGKYGEDVPDDQRATEIFHFKIGSGTYGKPRWLGNLISVYGARKAEELNYMYFHNGRHIPAAITVSNGKLDEASYNQLQEYMDGLSGPENAHKFLLLEVEGNAIEETDTGQNEKLAAAKVEIKSLAEILQQDALFLDYDEKTRQKIRSSFRLPPLYTGEAQEFSRATADTARKVTEEQVFQPERKTLARILNTLFLEQLQFKHVKLSVKGPDFHDPMEIAKVLGPFIQGGAVSPNDLRPLLEKVLGRRLDSFTDEYNVPIQMLLQKNITGELLPIEKGAIQQSELLNILKDLRDVLEFGRNE